MLLGVLHLRVEFVEELVPEQAVISEIELAACIPEAVIVASPGEVEPFRVTEFVTLEVQVSLAAKSVR